MPAPEIRVGRDAGHAQKPSPPAVAAIEAVLGRAKARHRDAAISEPGSGPPPHHPHQVLHHPHTEEPHLRYMPPLDGVRAFAVAAVVCFHAGVPGTGGLYMGVDGFFVLSGFLITSLLIGDWRRNGTVSFGSFYSRRARRLFPALLLLLVVIVFAEMTWGDATTFSSIRGDALAALFYCSNWFYIATHSGYFGAALSPGPLQHTWSLAIEEQFYLVWPVVVFVVLRRVRTLTPLMWIALGGAAVSAATMALVYGNGQGLNHAYYGTDSRAQALLVGCALAIALTKWRGILERRAIGRLHAAGIAGFVLAAAVWWKAAGPPAWMFRGGFLLSDLAVAAVIASCVVAPRGGPAKLLGLRPMRALGKISYGVYLWMFPVTQLFDEQRTGFSGVGLFALRVFAILLVATVSYFLIERPIRRGVFLKGWKAWVATPTAVVATTVGAVALGAIVPAVASASAGLPVSATVPAYALGDPVRILLVGDSVAVTLGWGLAQREKPFGADVRDEALIGCGVLTGGIIDDKGSVGPEGGSAAYCPDQLAQYPKDMASTHPDVSVLLVGRWECLDHNWGDGWEHVGQPDFDRRLVAGFDQVISVLSANRTPVVLLTSPYFEQGDDPSGKPWPQGDPARVDAFNEVLRQVAAASRGAARVVDLNTQVDPNGQYAEAIGGVVVRNPSDGVHFTMGNPPNGGTWLAPWLLPQLVDIGLAHRNNQVIT